MDELFKRKSYELGKKIKDLEKIKKSTQNQILIDKLKTKKRLANEEARLFIQQQRKPKKE